jgi:phosphoribosylglycinamide formyltransferase-1
MKQRLALFVSGRGSNAANLIRIFANHAQIEIGCLISSTEKATANHLAALHNLPIYIQTKNEPARILLDFLHSQKTDWIVLAGYVKLIPAELISIYEGKILNLHPALLPGYGGKGMYGNKIHEQVLKNQESETGITIHQVNERYDEGEILFQKKIRIEKNATVESLAQQIHSLEYEWYPKVIEKTVLASVAAH